MSGATRRSAYCYEHGNDSLFHTAVGKESLIAFFSLSQLIFISLII